MQYLIGFLFGVALTLLCTLLSRIVRTCAIIDIDNSREDTDIFKLTWIKDPHMIPIFKYIVVDIQKAKLNTIKEEVPPSQKNDAP